MMIRKVFTGFTIAGLFLLLTHGLFAQDTLRLNIQQVIQLATEQSPQAILAKHQFRASYWAYRTYQAKYRPALSMNATLPDYLRVFEKEYDFNTGQEYYVEKNTNNSTLGLSLTQNIGFTGGSIFTSSDLTRFDVFGSDRSVQYISTPMSIGLRQPIFDYNPLKWEKRIEPIKYEEAKKSYLDAMESVNMRAVNLFFNLTLAQLNQEIAHVNYSNADTLYRIAQGRYNIGTIAEDELLQMELRLLNAGTALNRAGIDLQIQEFQLRSFLGYNENVQIQLIIPSEIPDLEVNVDQVLSLARKNNPEILDFQRQLLEAQRDVAQARLQKGLNANLFATFGLTQRANDFSDAYRNPLDQQRVRIGFELPIVDWGLGRGRYKLAQSNEEVVKTNVAQAKIDFQQSIILNVAQFNLQDDQVLIAAKADTTARKRYEVTKQRFLIGKIAVLDLNVADSEKDVAKRGYISALRDYWTYFYNLRKMTLYDFINQRDLSADFDRLVR
ncbi:MAG: TolC family protein [Chlorobi bacterium]|nr:TolC family protein [Chlorobiota bacterium]